MHPLKSLLIALLLIPAPALAEDHEEEKAAVEAEPKTFVSQHEIRIDGDRVKYKATAGTLIMRDDEGEPIR